MAKPHASQSTCPFCRIAEHDPDAQIEVVVGDSIVITPMNPVVPGHKLVIPITHVESAAADPKVTGWAMRDAAAYLQRMGVGDCNVITSVGAAATQTVKHLHFHLVPRRAGDGLHLPWTGQEVRRAA
jgi:histidine triad (HIT) family protein